MIIKILSSANNFEGIDYSERKNDLGKSQLLKAGNFEALGHHGGAHRKADYINYMKLVCDANPRVKKRQFHAVLSAKGQDRSPEELGKFAEQYLKSMGYGENPYLIYFHKDTDNNHVHMVSTRVDKNGKKVDDRYEKIRSQKVLQSILNQDPAIQAKSAIEQAMQYNFSTRAQFKLLLELHGYKISDGEGKLKIIKYGTVQTAISTEEVEKKIAAYIVPAERIKQLKAIFHKYKRGLELEAFQKRMHQKFGVELIFHQNSMHEKPYGYTIIDHKKREMLKGSQVVPLQTLMLPIAMAEKKELLNYYLNRFDFENRTFRNLSNGLASIGMQINQNWEIMATTNQKPILVLDPLQVNQLKYNSRVAMASSYTVNSEISKNVLSNLFKIQIHDISISSQPSEDVKNYYRDILLYGNQSRSLQETFDVKGLEIIKFEHSQFMLDRPNQTLFEIKPLLSGKTIDLAGISVKDLDWTPGNAQNQSNSISNQINRLSQIFDLQIAEQNNDLKKRKKKQRQM